MNVLLISSLPTPDIFSQWSFSLAAHVNTYVSNIESKQSSELFGEGKIQKTFAERNVARLVEWHNLRWNEVYYEVLLFIQNISPLQNYYAQFIITSFCRPNLKELCDTSTDDVNRAAKLPNDWTVNIEELGMRLSCFGFLKLFFKLGIMLGVIRLNPLLDLPNSSEDTKVAFNICNLSARFKTSCLISPIWASQI